MSNAWAGGPAIYTPSTHRLFEEMPKYYKREVRVKWIILQIKNGIRRINESNKQPWQ